jgi:shikimate kinase
VETARLIFLIGPPAVGKTTVGRVLAEHMDRLFVDIDRQIEREAGMSVRQIFTEEGEPSFRRRETATLRSIGLVSMKHAAAVVAVGGGTPCYDENLDWMLSSGVVVRLTAERPALLVRIAEDSSRPLVHGAGVALAERLDHLLAAREPFYARAHFCLDTTFLSASAVAAEAADRLRTWR